MPADAKAAVVSPSLVSDRYLQLLPAYTGGAALRSGADIPLARTAVPVELDQVTGNLDQLTKALGPNGANSGGALSDLLDTASKNLDGNGQRINDTIANLSQATATLAGGKDDLFTTVKNLQSFTSTLAANDPQVRALNTELASVSDQLSGERGDLGAALQNLAVALTQVSTLRPRQPLGPDDRCLAAGRRDLGRREAEGRAGRDPAQRAGRAVRPRPRLQPDLRHARRPGRRPGCRGGQPAAVRARRPRHQRGHGRPRPARLLDSLGDRLGALGDTRPAPSRSGLLGSGS